MTWRAPDNGGNGCMIIYDPDAHKRPGYEWTVKPWVHGAFDGCFGDRTNAGLQSWIVVWPEWML